MKISPARALTAVLLLGGLGVATFSSLAQTTTPVLARASKSSNIAITSDDARVIVTNSENDSVSVFDLDNNRRIATVRTGD
ncbi:MAG: hypothetical protein ACK41E_11400, partial [Deinococcales bacterium]